MSAFSKFRRQGRDDNLDALKRLHKHGVVEAELDRLEFFITSAMDKELYQVNPYYVLEQLRLGADAGLKLIVAALAEGILELNWQLTCPACQMAGEPVGALKELPQAPTCPNCHTSFVTHIDEEITVSLTVSEYMRSLNKKTANDPHFREQVDKRLGRFQGLDLINVPGFRYMVIDQALEDGQSLGVKELTIFFSDLRQSTALYHNLGDAEAYRLVSTHFRLIFEQVERFGGAAVKTIGDGVMGVFTDASAAMESIEAIHQGLIKLNYKSGLAAENRLVLKHGIHRGPCIVVTLNNRLDYFGETVNIAARLSDLSVGGDVILSPKMMADQQVVRSVAKMGQVEPLAAVLKGLSGEYSLHRLQLRIPT